MPHPSHAAVAISEGMDEFKLIMEDGAFNSDTMQTDCVYVPERILPEEPYGSVPRHQRCQRHRSGYHISGFWI